MVLALGIVLEDVVVLAAGAVIGSGGVVVIVTLGSALVHLVRSWF